MNFTELIEFGNAENETRSIDLGDFNKDGFLDIITGNLGSENIIYFSNKKLAFDKIFTFKEKRMTASIKVTDLNQDGFLDIVEGIQKNEIMFSLVPKVEYFKK